MIVVITHLLKKSRTRSQQQHKDCSFVWSGTEACGARHLSSADLALADSLLYARHRPPGCDKTTRPVAVNSGYNAQNLAQASGCLSVMSGL